MQELRLRDATPEDAPLLRRWDEDPEVLESDPDSDWEWEKELPRRPPWREMLIAEVEGRPMGFLQVIDPREEDSHYWGDVPPGLRAIDIWIGEPQFRNRGFGTRMMRMAIARCFADATVEAILIDPLAGNERAHRFYERLGFRFDSERWFGTDHCFIYRLERNEAAARGLVPDQRAGTRLSSGFTT